MKQFLLILLILSYASCIGCTSKEFDQQKESAIVETGVKTREEGEKKTLEEELLLQMPPVEFPQIDRESLIAVIEGNNRFAFDLFHQLGQKPGNTFFSPYSISTALGMTYAGARGNTAKELSRALHFTLGNERLHSAFGELIRKVNGAHNKRNYELSVANSLWANKTDLSLDPNFLRCTQSDYQADFQLVDFVRDAEGARQSINGWVENKTKNNIVDIIPAGLITKDTRLMLVNAIYFKGHWAEAFPLVTTTPDDFTIPGSPAIKVPMMNHVFNAPYMENTDFQIAQFTYKDNDISMVVILPKKKDGLAEVEKKLSAKTLSQALELLRASMLHVTFPRFKITQQVSLGAELKQIGIQDAFLPGIADFSGIETKLRRKEDSLYICEVLHKAFVAVDEKGTEAAAATAAEVNFLVGETISPPVIRFRADHPFLFLLRHNVTGSILFMGRMSDPRGN